MTIDELCQLIRQINMNQFRAELDYLKQTKKVANGSVLEVVQDFIEDCYRQPK